MMGIPQDRPAHERQEHSDREKAPGTSSASAHDRSSRTALSQADVFVPVSIPCGELSASRGNSYSPRPTGRP